MLVSNWSPFALVALVLFAATQWTGAEKSPEVRWVNAEDLTLEGQGWTDTAAPFDRLPARAQGVVPGPVWGLSRDSAGIAVRFVTDGARILCRWKLRSGNLAMDHMPATGVSGVDLYMRTPPGQEIIPGQHWRWVGVGRPKSQLMEAQLAGGLPAGEHEFLLYLPLYNGVESVEVGVPAKATLHRAPDRPLDHGKPVVFYGTSITQGGCASRPGMAYPALLGRWLDRPAINLGFSGNGRMDPPVVDFIAELEAAAFVIDCCPNMPPDLIADRTEPLVHKLRSAHPQTPVILVENVEYQASALLAGPRRAYTAKNAALRAAYERLVKAGVSGLHLVPGKSLFGDDGEATVDGTHATDLGFVRLARALLPVLSSVTEGRVKDPRAKMDEPK